MAIVIAAYSPAWPPCFRRLRRELLPVFAGVPARIVHIGSTSVPGLAAKPVIDLLLGTPTLADIESRVADITALGYAYRPHYAHAIPERRYFVKDATDGLRVHLHGVEHGARLWRDHLRFRDLLRTDDARRREYEALKRRLATLHPGDKAAYTRAKAPYIEALLASSAP
jgi:GrpB-like predicted nucleotidyltransferase (UPF0157 family)